MAATILLGPLGFGCKVDRRLFRCLALLLNLSQLRLQLLDFVSHAVVVLKLVIDTLFKLQFFGK